MPLWQPIVIATGAVALVAALALVVTPVAGWFTGGPEETSGATGTQKSTDDEGGPSTAPADNKMRAWTAPANEGPRPGEVIRTLAAGDDLIVVTQRDITSIDRRTGKKNWHTALEEYDTAEGPIAFCGASTTAADGHVALSLGVDLNAPDSGNVLRPTCGLVTSIDLRTGTIGGTVQLAYKGGGAPKGQEVDGMPVDFVGDQIVATWNATIFGLDASGFSTKWKLVVGDQKGRQGDLCTVEDMAVGGAGTSVVVLSHCITDRGETDYYVDEISDSGRLLHTYQPTDSDAQVEISSLTLISATPAVIAVYPGVGTGAENEDGALITLDDSFKLGSVIHDERTRKVSDNAFVTNPVGRKMRVGAYRIPSRSLVSGDTMVSFTPPNRGKPNKLVATDLRTGRDIWESTAPSGTVIWQVLAVEKGRVMALASDLATDTFGHHVVSVDAKTGKNLGDDASTVKTPAGDTVTPTDLGYVYADGRAYAVEFGSAGQLEGTFPAWMAFSVG
jgi:outer membrane protein assembly factor BamB